jgi:hypothetical protein
MLDALTLFFTAVQLWVVDLTSDDPEAAGLGSLDSLIAADETFQEVAQDWLGEVPGLESALAWDEGLYRLRDLLMEQLPPMSLDEAHPILVAMMALAAMRFPEEPANMMLGNLELLDEDLASIVRRHTATRKRLVQDIPPLARPLAGTTALREKVLAALILACGKKYLP